MLLTVVMAVMGSDPCVTKLEVLKALVKQNEEAVFFDDTELVVAYEEGETVIPIPKYVKRGYVGELRKWASLVHTHVIKNLHGKVYTATQVARGNTMRLCFEFYTDKDDDVHAHKSRAKELAQKYFKCGQLCNDDAVYIVKYNNQHSSDQFVRAVFPTTYVSAQILREMLDVPGVLKSMKEDRLEPRLMENDANGSHIPLIGTPISGKLPCVAMNKDEFVRCIPFMLGGPVVLTKFNMKHTTMSASVKQLIYKFKEEEKAKARKAEDVPLQQGQKLPGIDLSDNRLLDDQKLLDMFHDPLDDQYVEYINNFVVHVSVKRNQFGVKRLYNRTGQMYVELMDKESFMTAHSKLWKFVQIETEDNNGELKLRRTKVEIMKAWLQHIKHLQVYSIVFAPGEPTLVVNDVRFVPLDMGLDHVLVPPQVQLNVFTDFSFKFLKLRFLNKPSYRNAKGPKAPRYGDLGSMNLKDWMNLHSSGPRSKLAVILHHMYSVFCSGNSIMFWALNAWMSNILRNPMHRSQACIMITGMFGVGKSKFWQALGKYMFGQGMLYHYFGGDGERLTGRFNGSFQGLFIFIDEAENCDPKAAARIKSLITESTLMTERKFEETVTMDNYMNFVFCGNSLGQVIEPGDRRYWIMECNPAAKEAMTKAQRDALADACSDNDRDPNAPEGIMQYEKWLAENEEAFNNFDFYVQPYMTPKKRSHIMENMHSVYKWWVDVMTSQVEPQRTTRSISEQFYGQGGGDDDSTCIKWSGQTTWETLYKNYEARYRGLRNESLFERLLIKCVVLYTEPVSVGREPVARSKRPVYFGCLEACWAQFEVFIKRGTVHEESAASERYENKEWLSQLYEDVFRKERKEDLENHHVNCVLCSRCSMKYKDVDRVELAANAKDAIWKEDRGELPDIFFKKLVTPQQEFQEKQKQALEQRRLTEAEIIMSDNEYDSDEREFILNGGVDTFVCE